LLYCFAVSWRALIVGIGYLIALIVVGGILSAAAVPLPQTDNVRVVLRLSFLASVLTGLVLGPIALEMPASRFRHIIVWASVLFLNGVTIVIEASFFVPAMKSAALALVIQYFVTALVVAGLIMWLFAPSVQSHPITAYSKRTWHSWAW
jgi:hypothetical protein